MAVARSPAREPRPALSLVMDHEIARAARAIATTTVGTGPRVLRVALVAIGAVADRMVKPPQRAPYRPPPASLSKHAADR